MSCPQHLKHEPSARSNIVPSTPARLVLLHQYESLDWAENVGFEVRCAATQSRGVGEQLLLR